MLFHLHSVSKNHVQVKYQILDLQFQQYNTAHQLNFIVAATYCIWMLKYSAVVVTYLLWEGCVSQLQIFFSIRQDCLE